VDTSFYYFLNHVTPFAGVTVGSRVLAGQGIGQNSGLSDAVDFGVYNFNNPLTGIHNSCMAKALKYVDSPLKYYSVAAQQVLDAKIATTGAATKYGRIDYDENRKLGGNWVRTGSVPIVAPDQTLAFAYNVSNHALRISMGSSLSGGGAYAVQAGAKDFALVTQANGQLNHRLYPTGSGDSYAQHSMQFVRPTHGGGPEIGWLARLEINHPCANVDEFLGLTNRLCVDGGNWHCDHVTSNDRISVHSVSVLPTRPGGLPYRSDQSIAQVSD
jgi:hypothetical protein